MKIKYYNDTGRVVSIHPATFSNGCTGNPNPIQPLEEREFKLPIGTYPWIKMWDDGEKVGLMILISPIADSD